MAEYSWQSILSQDTKFRQRPITLRSSPKLEDLLSVGPKISYYPDEIAFPLSCQLITPQATITSDVLLRSPKSKIPMGLFP